jgi:hypothetical protein
MNLLSKHFKNVSNGSQDLTIAKEALRKLPFE